MATNNPTPQGNAGGHTWYGGGNTPPNQAFGNPPPGWGGAAGFGPAQPAGAGGGAFAAQGQPVRLAPNETMLAGIAHLSSFFAPLIVPLLIWLLVRDNMPYASRQGKQAFFFHLIFSLIAGALGLIFFFVFFLGFYSAVAASVNSDGGTPGALVFYPLWTFLFIGVIVAISLLGQVFAVYAAIQTFQGKPFSYPFMQRL